MKLLWGLILLTCSSTAILSAQNSNKIYTVQVGTFIDAAAADFAVLKPLGFVYGQRLENNVHRVFVGSFEKPDVAQRVADQVKQRGYIGAAVVPITVDDGRVAMIIQFATLNPRSDINWEKYQGFSNLFALISEDAVKLVTGPYANAGEARVELDRIKKAGYPDAFIKRVSTGLLQKITAFETGLKQPLIPLDLRAGQTGSPAAPAGARETQAYADNSRATPAQATLTARDPGAAAAVPSAQPSIRPNIKRRSALELQKVLKSENVYQGSLDGLYGNGTAAAYEQALRTNRDLQKFAILAGSMKLTARPGVSDQLQSAIDNLVTDAGAISFLERAQHPVASVYRAYLLFTQIGPDAGVNTLMNSAIRQAYSGKVPLAKAPFDYSATYAYNDIDQLLLHLYYIHLAPGIDYAAPCWLIQRHPKLAMKALNTAEANSRTQLNIQGCDPFLEWDDARLAIAIAVDLNGQERIPVEPLAKATAERSRLYLNAQPLDAAQAGQANAWNDRVWKGLNGWAAADPLHQRLVDAFKIAFYQTLIRVEDFYMDKGIAPEPAKVLALATARTMVGPHLGRFEQ